MAKTQQAVGKIATDEAGGAGDEKFQRLSQIILNHGRPEFRAVGLLLVTIRANR